MEAVIFTGIQASGKSTFYRERFFHTHVRVSLDLLKTRSREQAILRACLTTQQRFVVDNTNPTAADRARYLAPAKAAGFRLIGYFFVTEPKDAIRRNRGREGGAVIPVPGILGTLKRLEEPTYAEGFDELFRVRIVEEGRFEVTPLERED